MHSISHFLHKSHSRETTPPLKEQNSTESWYSTLSSDSTASVSRAVPCGGRAGGDPFQVASSPRDRYPNFASYFREVMESRPSPATASRAAPLPSLFNDLMDDIQENEYSKCERYGEIRTSYRHRLDNRSFAQRLTDADAEKRPVPAPSNNKHKHHSIHELIKSFGKKVGGWRHETGEFRSRSRSLDAGSTLDDCGATYRIYDAILKEGAAGARCISGAGGAALRRGSLPAAAVMRRGADDPHHAAMLFRDSRGLPVADPFLEKVSRSDLEEDSSQIFVKFFKFHKCYDLIPTSAKLVVFDTQLLVKKAFFALVYNGVRAAPLWDSVRQQFVGMLTITDFIKILQMYYTSPDEHMEQLEEHRLDTWRALGAGTRALVSIAPDASLYDAIRMLVSNRIHRLPVIDPDTGNVLYILTHKRILRFLFLYIGELPRPWYLETALSDLELGTRQGVELATEDTSIIDALRKFVTRRVSALPIVDHEGRLKDIYAKFDVINLAAEKTYNNLDVPLREATAHRTGWFEGVTKCTLDETLFSAMQKIVRAEVHRLVLVDHEDKVVGIVSLSDLLMFLVLRPASTLSSNPQPPPEPPAEVNDTNDSSDSASETET